ncbi:MAG: type II toxin-antitoxin system VapC family toxin [Gemmatimonadaceae bacterium]
MSYWDASAIVPLIVAETESALVRSWAAREASIMTWAWTRVEVAAAVERRVREGSISASRRRDVLARLAQWAEVWDEVTDVLAVRTRAIPLLARHALRAADSAQLAAALLVAEADPSAVTFVCLDHRLAEAAEREGFRVLSSSSDKPG